MPTADAEAGAEEPEELASTVERKILKPVPKPDEDELKSQIEEHNAKIVHAQGRLAAIKESLDARDTGRGDSPEVALAKHQLNQVKAKARLLQQEKRNIYDQISAADELKKQQQDLTQRLKTQLSLFSVEEIERKIKLLEHQQQTTSLSVKEDKKIMEEIKRLASNKPMIRQYDEAQESLKGVRDHHSTLYTQLKAKNADLSVIKEEEDRLKENLEAVKAKEDAKKSDIPSLYKERDSLRKEIVDHRDVIRKLRDDFNERRKEWQLYQKQQKEAKYREWAEHKAKRQAEYEAQKRAFEEEEAKRDPWEEEKIICEQLIVFVEKYLPKNDVRLESDEAGAKPFKKGGAVQEEDDPYAGILKKKSKRKGGANIDTSAASAKPKVVRLSHSPDDFMLWEKLGFTAPASSDACPGLHAELLAKREWLKTAPPKKKKIEPKVENEAPSEQCVGQTAAPADAESNGFDLKTFEAEELKKKQAAAEKKAQEQEELERKNAERDAQIAATGKRAAGGMHKFDPDEVDVHGGNATADDFLDAFGFGDEAGGTAAEGVAAVQSFAPTELIHIKALSEDTVAVKLSLKADK